MQTTGTGNKEAGFGLLIFSISLATFMASLDGTIVNIALPTLSQTVVAHLLRSGDFKRHLGRLRRALRERRGPHPSPAEVWRSVELSHRIQQAVGNQTAQPDRNR